MRLQLLWRQLPNRKNVAWYGVSERNHCAPKKVLVVEDNADDVELLQIAARTAPDAVSFHIVPDGEKALAYLKGEGQYADRHAHPFPDLILLDLWLPGINGFEVLAWIRTHRELKALPVFVWTDSGDRETLDRATQAGADRFVPKSVSFVRGGMAGLVRSISEAIVHTAKKDGLQTNKC